MSHFTLLVPANNEEELAKHLEPYNEQPDDGSPYLKFHSAREEYTERWNNPGTIVWAIRQDDGTLRVYKSGEDQHEDPRFEEVHPSAIYLDVDHYMRNWGGLRFNETEQEYGYYHNPDAKWDWWSVGGRYKNTLILKSGDRADAATKGEIDWDRHAALARVQARERWHAFRQASELQARKAAGEAIDVTEFLINSGLLFASKEECALLESLSLEEYIEHEAQDTSLTYAFIDKEGKWHGVGHMGWCGISSDEQRDAYSAEWETFFASLEDSDKLYMVDCHI